MNAPLSKEAKSIVYNIHGFFKKRKLDLESIEHETDANLVNLTTEVTGITASRVKKVLSEGRASLEDTGKIIFMDSVKPRQYKKKTPIKEECKSAIKKKIHYFSQTHHRMPSVPELNKILKKDGNWKYEETFLRRLLLNMGYKFVTVGKSKRKVMMVSKQSEDGDAIEEQLHREIRRSSRSASKDDSQEILIGIPGSSKERPEDKI